MRESRNYPLLTDGHNLTFPVNVSDNGSIIVKLHACRYIQVYKQYRKKFVHLMIATAVEERRGRC